MPQRLKRLVHWIEEPRVQRTAFFFVYALHFVAGLAIMGSHPRAVAEVIGTLGTYAWGAFLAVGGLIGAVAVLPGWNFIEKIAILAVLAGVALTSVLVIATPWSEPSVQILIWSMVTGWVVIFSLRSYEIRFYTIAPRIKD